MSSRRHVIRNRGDVIRNLTQGGMIYRKLDARRVAAGRPLEALALPRRQPSVSGERPAAGRPLSAAVAAPLRAPAQRRSAAVPAAACPDALCNPCTGPVGAMWQGRRGAG